MAEDLLRSSRTVPTTISVQSNRRSPAGSLCVCDQRALGRHPRIDLRRWRADQAITARTYVRVRLRAAPGAFVSIVLTDTGVYRIAEQLDAERPPRIIAQGNLPSSRHIDERGWSFR